MAAITELGQQQSCIPKMRSFIFEGGKAGKVAKFNVIIDGALKEYIAKIEAVCTIHVIEKSKSKQDLSKVFSLWEKADGNELEKKYEESLKDINDDIEHIYRVDVWHNNVLFHFLNSRWAFSYTRMHDAADHFRLREQSLLEIGTNLFCAKEKYFYTAIFTLCLNPADKSEVTSKFAIYDIKHPKRSPISRCNLNAIFKGSVFRCYQAHVCGGHAYFALAKSEDATEGIIYDAAILRFEVLNKEFDSLGEGFFNPHFFKNRMITLGPCHRIDGRYFKADRGYHIRVFDLQKLTLVTPHSHSKSLCKFNFHEPNPPPVSKAHPFYKMKKSAEKKQNSGDWFLKIDEDNSKVRAITYIFPENITNINSKNVSQFEFKDELSII